VLPWWGWVLLWAVLLLGAGLVLGRLAWRLWGSTRALGREVQRAAALVAELEARADEMRDLRPPPTTVTQPLHRVRVQYREQRATAAAARRERRAERMPPWARVD
jgi:hypothetical protein